MFISPHFHFTPHSFHPTFISPHVHFTPHSFHPMFISPHVHFTPHSFHPMFISPHIHFTPCLFHPTFISPHIHFTPCSFHPTFIWHHIVIIQKRLTLINQLTINLWCLLSLSQLRKFWFYWQFLACEIFLPQENRIRNFSLKIRSIHNCRFWLTDKNFGALFRSITIPISKTFRLRFCGSNSKHRLLI